MTVPGLPYPASPVSPLGPGAPGPYPGSPLSPFGPLYLYSTKKYNYEYHNINYFTNLEYQPLNFSSGKVTLNVP